MTAETLSGEALGGFNAAITSPTAINLGVLGAEIFIIGGIAVYTYNRVSKVLSA